MGVLLKMGGFLCCGLTIFFGVGVGWWAICVYVDAADIRFSRFIGLDTLFLVACMILVTVFFFAGRQLFGLASKKSAA